MKNRIKELRKRNSLTQKELADHLGTFQSVISKCENGQYPEGDDIFCFMSDFFRCSTEYLLGKDYEIVFTRKTNLIVLLSHDGIRLQHDLSDEQFRLVKAMIEALDKNH